MTGCPTKQLRIYLQPRYYNCAWIVSTYKFIYSKLYAEDQILSDKEFKQWTC